MRYCTHSISRQLFLFLVFPFYTFAQIEADEKGKYRWFDTMIGQTNSGMFKGVLYENEYRVVNEKHQFFKSKDFKSGSVVYYGQPYFDIDLKYDVYLDNLLVTNDELANNPIMVFDKNGVSEFQIEGNSFAHITHNFENTGLSGFFQVLQKLDALTLYKNLRKKIFKRTDEQVVYYEFKDDFSYVLQSGDTYHIFKKVRELSRIFPKLKKQIKSARKINANLKKSDYDEYTMTVLVDILQTNPSPEPEEL